MKNKLFELCSAKNPPPTQNRRLLKHLATEDIHATDKNGVTALHHAVRFRNPTAVRILLRHGANPNQACRRTGANPLHRALTQTGAPATAGKQKQTHQIIRHLLAAGADPTLPNKTGRTPLHYAKTPTLQTLLKNAKPKIPPTISNLK